MIEDCHVEEVLTEKQQAIQNDRVTGAVTPKGTIKCDVFINCTGMVINQKTKLLDRFFFLLCFQWARELGFQATPNVRIPTQACGKLVSFY